MKTTNAKTHAIQTPAPPETSKPLLKTNKKPSSTKKMSKVTIAQPEPTSTDILSQEDDSDSSVPEPEYAPPNPTPLPDPPFDFGYDETFPQFQGANLTRGFGALYSEPCDAEGVPLSVREQQKRDKENLERIDKEILQMHETDVNEALERMAREPEELDRKVDEMIRRGDDKRKRERAAKASASAQRRTGPSTIKARSAATALNGNIKAIAPKTLPTATVPKPRSTTTTTKAPTARLNPKPKSKSAFSVHSANPNPVPSTTAPLKPATHNTLGYTRGRNVSSNIRRPAIPTSTTPSTSTSLSSRPKPTPPIPSAHTRKPHPNPTPAPIDQSTICPRSFRQLYGDPPMGSTMWYRVQTAELGPGPGLFDGEGEEVEGEEGLDVIGGLEEWDGGDAEEVFQLKMPGEGGGEGKIEG